MESAKERAEAGDAEALAEARIWVAVELTLRELADAFEHELEAA